MRGAGIYKIGTSLFSRIKKAQIKNWMNKTWQKMQYYI